MSIDHRQFPETTAEWLTSWDKGDVISMVELGGMGPGYELAIQILVFEILRDHLNDKELSACSEEWLQENFGEAAIKRCDEGCHGFSGAQVGAAKSFAYSVLKKGGPRALVKASKLSDDRIIMTSKHSPKAP